VDNRRKIRLGMKVIHRHRIGERIFRRVSELVMIAGKPKALLGWINLGGVRTPIYLCDLEHAKLRQSQTSSSTFYYDETTVDPRFEALGPSQQGGDLPSSVA
jgi:hypothetical protein